MTDRLKQSFQALVKLALPSTDYHALYPCRVVAQNADGSLELAPDSQKLGSVSNVPIRLGIPDCRAVVSPGARVLLGFENGSPSRPVATLWDSSSLITFELGAGAVDAVVRGTTYRTAEDAYLGALVTAINALAAVVGPIAAGPGAPAFVTPATAGLPLALTTAITNLGTAVTAFNAGAASYLSPVFRVR